ncbi:hypothetical protein SDC9_75222 [bioreactor metagenome]|uniref:Holin family protein n=1 Tax=bioreactor metagenome TaxID=1076179 RepID=A0A644YJE1_9ZZZZ
MDKYFDNLKIVLALLGGILQWLFGGLNSLIYALIAFVGLDYLTGILLAICEKKISSEIGFRGISKKILIFALIALGNIIDQYILSSGGSLKTMLTLFYLSNEGISILENTAKIGLPLPQKLKDVLAQIGDKGEK